MAERYTEIDGESALFCEIEGIPIKHYNRTFKITEANLEKAARLMLQHRVIKIQPTEKYVREDCRF